MTNAKKYTTIVSSADVDNAKQEYEQSRSNYIKMRNAYLVTHGWILTKESVENHEMDLFALGDRITTQVMGSVAVDITKLIVFHYDLNKIPTPNSERLLDET